MIQSWSPQDPVTQVFVSQPRPSIQRRKAEAEKSVAYILFDTYMSFSASSNKARVKSVPIYTAMSLIQPSLLPICEELIS